MRRTTPDQRQQQLASEYLDRALDGLQQRELLEPALLLGAGYVALPFLLRQGLLLLTPLLALCGVTLGSIALGNVALEREEATHAGPE